MRADLGERAHVDDGGAQLGQLALGQVGVVAVERVGDDEPAPSRRGTPGARWWAGRRSRRRSERCVRARRSSDSSTGPPTTSLEVVERARSTGRCGAVRRQTRPTCSRVTGAGSALVLGALGDAVVTALVGATGRARDVRLGGRTCTGGTWSAWSAVAFQFARRERVLQRDIFRFGTATSVPLLCRCCSACRSVSAVQRRPPGVDHFVVVVRVVRERAPRTRSTAPGSRPGTPAGTAATAPPRPAAPARGRSGRPRAGAPRPRPRRPPPRGGGPRRSA